MRTLFAVFLFIIAVVAPWYVFFATALVYAFRYFALEILFITFMVDVYFGVGMLPAYTLGALSILILLEWYKTFSSFYNS
jgi:hypothetical protein